MNDDHGSPFDATPWHAESAGFHVIRHVLSVQPTMTCSDALAMLREQRFEYADVVVVIDAAQRVLGMLSTGELATHERGTLVGRVMHRDVGVASAEMDQEHVASLAIRNALGTVPVTDQQGRLLGVVPPQTMLAVLRREHVEDLHRLTGILRENEVAREAMEGPPARRARHRLPWLFVGLAGSAIAALIMASFEATLQARVAVTFFLPGIVYIADAIGTQTEAIAIRGLSFGHARIQHLLAGELWTGLLIGAILAATSGLAVWLVLQDSMLALAVSVAVLAAGAIAAAIGLLLPWTFHRFGFDPAYGSGPLATVTQDVLSLLVYFGSVSVFLPLE
jgi:magnesium transporter